MERRKFIIGAGALATGTSAAVGTGAFSQMEADRGMSVRVSNDDSQTGALKFETANLYDGYQERSIYAEVDGGNLDIDLAEEGGANVNAEFNYRNVVRIDNESDHLDLLLGVDLSDAKELDTIDDMEFYVSDGQNDIDDSDMAPISETLDFDGPGPNELAVPNGPASEFGAPETISPGESRYLHIYINTSGDNAGDELDVSFGAVDLNASPWGTN